MALEIKVPTLGESVTEATVGQWFKHEGEAVTRDEPLVELETDKVTIEVPAPASGRLEKIAVNDGETVGVGTLLAMLAEGEAATQASATPAAAPAGPQPANDSGSAPAPAPSAAKLMEERGIASADIDGSGRHGQVLKDDVLAALREGLTGMPAGTPREQPAAPAPPAQESQPAPSPAPAPAAAEAPQPKPAPTPVPTAANDDAREERVRMTRLRQTIARRLKEAQENAAMLTTFNDVDMGAVMELRKTYRDVFEKKHGVRLGFMGFFVKACVHALKEIPAVNAEIDGDDLVYKNYYHVGVAVGTEKGLVVPVVRDAQDLSLADIEKTINDFGRRARDGALTIDEMQGGTFTISNGGVYGSLMSTPILNAPQSGILGMHRIEERPVVRGGEIVVRPIMYLALSYDHRIVDGREAVTFLVRIKEAIEDPQRLLLDL